MKTEVYNKRTFLPLWLPPSVSHGYYSNELLSQTQHCGYFIYQVGVTKMKNMFHVRGGKKTTQPAK